jgi:WD40 repeat protein
MFRFDRVLIDPTDDALRHALAEAARAANKGNGPRVLNWRTAYYCDFLASEWMAPEGQRQWQGAGPRGDTRSVAAVVWWTDLRGRKHCRVVSGRVGCDDTQAQDLFQPDNEVFRKGRERPLLWRVYPDDLYLRDAEGINLWAACRCGAVGTPEQLGWMGPWCAACHDRAEEGNPQAWPGVCRTVLAGHPQCVGQVVFHPGGHALLVGQVIGLGVWCWDLSTGEPEKRSFPAAGEPRIIGMAGPVVSADGRVAAFCVNGQVYIWSLLDGTVEALGPARLDSAPPSPIALALSPDGTVLATGSSEPHEGRPALHDVSTGQQLRTLALNHRRFHLSRHRLAFAPDGQTLAVGNDQPMVRRFDVASGQELPAFSARKPGQQTAVAYSPDGKTLAAGSPDFLQLWDAATGADRGHFPGPVTCLTFSPDSRLLATVGADACLRLRDAADGRLLATFRWHQSDIDTVAFSPDGRWIATGGKEDRVKLWPVDALLAG